MGEQPTFERVVMKLEDLTDEKLDQFCSRLVQQNETIIHDMEELKADLDEDFDNEEADLFFVPFLIAGAAMAAKAAVAAKAALVIKAAAALAIKAAAAVKAGLVAKAALAAKAVKATAAATKAGKFAAAAVKGAKGWKAAKMAKFASKAGRAGKYAGKLVNKSRHARKVIKAGKKFVKTRRGRQLKNFLQRTKKAAKVEFKNRAKQRENKYIDNFVEKNYPELQPYMKDIRAALKVTTKKGFRGLKGWMIHKVKTIAKKKVNKAVDDYVAKNFPELKPYMKNIKSLLKIATTSPRNLKKEIIKQAKKVCKKFVKMQVNDWMHKFVNENCPQLRPYMKDIKGALKAARSKGKKGLTAFLKKRVKQKMNQILKAKFRITLDQALKAAEKSRKRMRKSYEAALASMKRRKAARKNSKKKKKRRMSRKNAKKFGTKKGRRQAKRQLSAGAAAVMASHRAAMAGRGFPTFNFR